MVALSSHKQELLVRLDYLVSQTRGMDFVISDDTGNFSIDDELVKRIRALVRQAAELMLAVMNCYDAEADGTSEEILVSDDEAFLKEIGAQISSQLAVEEVSGLAFVSRGQLLDIVAAIDSAIEARQTWKVASHIDSGLRRAGRALIAIESAMRECEGLPVEYRQWHSLDDSLEVRRIYGEFRRTVLRGDEDPDQVPSGKKLATKLWHAAERIAVLRGREIYPYLRIDDRLQIRRLQKRILEWLDQGGTELETGAQLWSDLISFARLLAQVNYREELREHDRLAVDGLYRRFFEAEAVPRALTSEKLTLLEPLLGREDDLDKIILNPDVHSGNDLKGPLERLRKELGRPFEVPSSTGFSHPAPG